ncbi:MAG: ATP-binding protein, partial [Ktedonobacteraceae bacterium]|nr:ATP-binding protein [Ktedonobacteraceae bacterium]
MKKEQLIREALSLPANAIAYYVGQILVECFPDKALVEGQNVRFNVEEYARANYCRLEHKAIVHNQVVTHWQEHEMGAQRYVGVRVSYRDILEEPTESQQEIVDRSINAWFEVKWQGHTFDLVVMTWGEGRIYHYWIVSETAEVAKDFIAQVCRWNSELHGEVLVFDGNCWYKDARLYQSIRGSTFDNLILQGNLKRDIYEDLTQFFASRATYEQYGIPWKRGILFVGPPGNGKTHAVKAIINTMNQPCLYIKSFSNEHNIGAVFDRARKIAPCILVLEDLDALLTPENRSFFLNELDGFAANSGIVALATTNHPERLDSAILDRPSRFDRKYPFDLPEQAERLAYINMWNNSLRPALQISGEVAQRLSELTQDFSFAYLKELFLSSMMRW